MAGTTSPPGPTARLSLVLEQCPDAIVGIDAQGRINEWNPAAERMFGWTGEQIIGQSLHLLVPAVRQELLEQRLEALRRGDTVPPYETVRLHRDGSRRWVRVHVAALRKGAAYAGAVAVLQDLSEWQIQGQRTQQVLAALPVVLAGFDDDGVVTLAAGGGLQRMGLDPALVVGASLLDTLAGGKELQIAVEDALDHGRSSEVLATFDERVWHCHVTGVADPEAAGLGNPDARIGGVLSAVDITDQRLVTDRLDEVLAASAICLAIFDRGGDISYAAGAGYRALGLEPQDTVGENMFTLYGGDSTIRQALEDCLQGKGSDVVTEFGGRVWDLHYRAYADTDGGVRGGIAIGHDRTEWLSKPPDAGTSASPESGDVPQPLQRLLDHDELTGTLGRRGLMRHLRARAPEGKQRAIVVLDVDGFSAIHERHGTEEADKVLRELAKRLTVSAGQHPFGRWHADEFMLIVDGQDAAVEAEQITREMLDAAREPVRLGDLPLRTTLSAGLAHTGATSERDLTGPSRQALSAARRRGGDDLVCFEPGTAPPALGTLPLTHDLRAAVLQGGLDQFRLFLQPIVELSSQHVIGAEGLLRWQHPTFGLLGPDRFLDTAERLGLLDPLGDWVLDQTCQAAATLTASRGLQYVAMNLSGSQLTHPGLVDQVAQALQRHRCTPSSLVLEVTETAVVADMPRAVRTLQGLKELGVGLALDDFGTGYSSLLQLKHFPVDRIKIDRAFVGGLGTQWDDSAIVAATVSLATTLDMRCIAEGVETVDQLTLLRDLGCTYGQGYLFSRPQSLADMDAWLAGHTASASTRARQHQSEAPDHVARILAMHHEGSSIHTIAAALNREGLRTVKGARWSAPAVARVIAREQFPQLRLAP